MCVGAEGGEEDGERRPALVFGVSGFLQKKKKRRIEGVLAVCRGKWGFLVMEMRGHGLGEKEKRWPRGAVASFEKMKD
jgi:hypothetical protein